MSRQPWINLCACGCGKETSIGKRYMKGHTSNGGGSPYYVERDMGHDTPCWYWLRAVCKDGYPKASRGRMHRVYFEDAVRPLRQGEVIDHLCRVHRCVNPNHMEAVTPRENARRGYKIKLRAEDIPLMVLLRQHGISRRRVGLAFGVSEASIKQYERGTAYKDLADLIDDNPLGIQLKLTEEDVREIVARCSDGASYRSVAATFDISHAHVSSIMNGRTWSHVTGLSRRSA